MRFPASFRWCLATALVSLTAGCHDSGRLPVHNARGTVLVNGKPAPQALVVLHPREGASTVRPQATVDPDGTFRLCTYESGDGAPEGTYGVTVTWWRSPAKGKG